MRISVHQFQLDYYSNRGLTTCRRARRVCIPYQSIATEPYPMLLVVGTRNSALYRFDAVSISKTELLRTSRMF